MSKAAAIRLVRTETTSYFRGRPPRHVGSDWLLEIPGSLVFLACVDLAEVHRFVRWLPESGRLLFFYDEQEQPWGYRPQDRTKWKVVYVRQDRILPGFCEDMDEAYLREWPPVHIRFTGVRLASRLKRLWWRIRGREFSSHQIGGNPHMVQKEDMRTMCQLLANGFRGHDDPDLNEEIAGMLAPGIPDWKLLLQIDSDDDASFMWEDCGRLYFWVRESEARVGDFRNVRVLLQCH